MKKISLILLLSIYNWTFSQTDTIEINQFKTSQIIFNDEISLVEPGTGDLQVKNKIVDNVLILQSIVPQSDFIITNLFIKTKSNIYNPILKYNETPKKTTFLEKELQSAVHTVSIASTKKEIEDQKSTAVKKIDQSKITISKDDKISLNNVKDSDIRLVENIIKRNEAYKPSREYTTGLWFKFLAHYVFNGMFYLKFEIENTSDLDYNIENIFFSIQSRKKRNVTETQREINFTKFLNESEKINARTSKYLIYEFPTFSMNKNEEFLIEMKEKGGARNFIIGVPYFIINQPVKLELK